MSSLVAAWLHLHEYPIKDSTRTLLTAHLPVAGYRSALGDLSLASLREAAAQGVRPGAGS